MRILKNLFFLIRILVTFREIFYKISLNNNSILIKILNIIPKSSSKSLSKKIQKLGPIFIKFGQTLSTRADLIGEELANDLSVLQDKLPAFEFKYVDKIIQQELGGSIEKHFKEFVKEPVAAASIAQVHQAVTIYGEKVAVKIRRPEIELKLAQDLEIIYFTCKIIKIVTKIDVNALYDFIKEFEKTTKFELDLSFEAAALSEMRENFAFDQSLYIPKPNWQLTTQKILVMEWVEGISIDNLEQIEKSGLCKETIATNLAIIFFNQAYRFGFFHADLHAGNILVTKNNKIILIDFGITSRLNKSDRIHIARIIKAFLAKDYLEVAKIHKEAGYIPEHVDINLFSQNCRAIGEPIVGLPANKISIARLLAKLIKAIEDFQMRAQPQLLLLQKTILMVEGVGSKLHPEVNMWKLAEPWIQQWALENFGLEAKISNFLKNMKEKIK